MPFERSLRAHIVTAFITITDSKVMLAAIRCIEVLDTDHGRAKDLVLNGCVHKNSSVRLACIKILPRLMGDEVLRNHCNALLREEKDAKIRAELKQMAFDAEMEGTEAQKNAYLAPSPAVPQIDREIVEAQGKTVGLEELPPPVLDKQVPAKKDKDVRHG